MTTIIEKFNINSFGFNDIIDISPKINMIVQNLKFREGLVNIYTSSKTSVIFIGDKEDFIKQNNFLDETIKYSEKNINPEFYTTTLSYKANFFKNTLTIPFENSKLLTDNQNRIYFIDFENSKNNKEIIVTIIN